jgi:hypothetical protein
METSGVSTIKHYGFVMYRFCSKQVASVFVKVVVFEINNIMKSVHLP